MRVIAGKARSLRLKTIEGMDTRPTTDRIKETLFNMIQPSIADSRFLDLFAGSGGIGIEALSRGASCCVFVEQQRKAAECIRENLAFTRLKDSATLLVTDAVSAVRKLNGEEAFVLDFYGSAIWQRSGVSGAGSAAGNYVWSMKRQESLSKSLLRRYLGAGGSSRL